VPASAGASGVVVWNRGRGLVSVCTVRMDEARSVRGSRC
jgi:hypothetical protein